MEWECIAQQFSKQWNLHNCIGAMDGKHIMIRPPANSGSFYYNYKHRFSIVLLAVVDADYKFIYVDIGCNGRISDGGVFRECSLSKALEEKSLNIPAPSPLPGRSDPIPYMMVADEAFPLKEYIMKPYSQRNLTRENRIFNYRLSRARRIVESAFGILANRFRAISSPLALDPDKVELIVMACCSLHNFLRSRIAASNIYTPQGSLDSEDRETHAEVPGEWRQGADIERWMPVELQSSNNYSTSAKNLRDYLRDYYNSKEGEVPWQWNMI